MKEKYRKVALNILCFAFIMPTVAAANVMDEASLMIEESMGATSLGEVKSLGESNIDDLNEAQETIDSISANETANVEAKTVVSEANQSIQRYQNTLDFQAWQADVAQIKAQLATNLDAHKTQRAPLLVFVSFSMPNEAIKHYMREADELGAAVVIRGLVDSTFPKTVEKIQKLIAENKEKGGINIDPVAFKALAIDKVPAVVLESDGKSDVVYGVGSIREALRLFSEEGETKEAAQSMLEHAA